MGAAQDSHTTQPDSPAPAPKIDDGGPAYPCHTDMVVIDQQANRVIPVLNGGMSLRDYFAAAAMQGMIGCGGTYDKWATLARDAFDVADAMLAVRKGGFA